MGVSLSSFLQWKSNIFVVKRLGWRNAFSFIIILGKIYFFFRKKEKHRIEEAIEVIFSDVKSDSEIRSIKKKVLRGMLSHYYEKFFNAYEDIQGLKTFLNKGIDATSLHKLDNALRKGKGVLFVTGHYGGIEYIPIFLGLNRYPVSVVARFATKQLKNSTYVKTKDLGIRLIDGNQDNRVLHSIIRELKANRIIFFECDEIEEWKPSRRERMFFLRKRVGVDKGINILQRRTEAEVVFGILHRFSLQSYSLIIENYGDILLGLGKAPSSMGEAVLKFFEQYIYSYPEQWYQWKDYAEIKTPPSSAFEDERPESPSLLEPAFGRTS